MMRFLTFFVGILLLVGCAGQLVLEPRADFTQWNPEHAVIFQTAGVKADTLVFDRQSGRSMGQLPEGRLAAAGHAHFVSNVLAENTQIVQFDPASGEQVDDLNVSGTWDLSAVSPNGHWLALTHLPSEDQAQTWQQAETWQTDVVVINRHTGEQANRLTLEGHFEVEALNNRGESLYLIEHLSQGDNPTYRVRLYNLNDDELDPNILRDKRIRDEFMTGYAWGTLQDTTGEWLFTLYVNTARESAFIHALNLDYGFTVCLDLPSGEGDFDLLQQYSIAYSAENKVIYATNTALGVVTQIDFEQGFEATVIEFDSAETNPNSNSIQTSLLNDNASQLIFSSGNQIWVMNTTDNTVSAPIQVDGAVQALKISRDGNDLFVATDNNQMTKVEIAREIIANNQ